MQAKSHASQSKPDFSKGRSNRLASHAIHGRKNLRKMTLLIETKRSNVHKRSGLGGGDAFLPRGASSILSDLKQEIKNRYANIRFSPSENEKKY